MAITDQQGTISLVDPDSGAELNQIRGLLNDDLAAVEFSSDGTLMLSMSGATVQLWDPLSGQQIDVPFPHNGSDPPRIGDGDAQLGPDVGEFIHVWNLDTSTWFDTAGEAAGPNMTRAEWEQFGPRDTEYRATCPQYRIES